MLAAVDSSTILALFGILLLYITFKRFGSRRANSSHSAVPQSLADAKSKGHPLDAPVAVTRWEVSMHDTARDLMGRLDSKIVIVEQLVREANEVATRLESLVVQIEKANGQSTPIESKSAPPMSHFPGDSPADHRAVE